MLLAAPGVPPDAPVPLPCSPATSRIAAGQPPAASPLPPAHSPRPSPVLSAGCRAPPPTGPAIPPPPVHCIRPVPLAPGTNPGDGPAHPEPPPPPAVGPGYTVAPSPAADTARPRPAPL